MEKSTTCDGSCNCPRANILQNAVLQAAIVIEWFEKIELSAHCAILEYEMRRPVSFQMDCAMDNLKDALTDYKEAVKKWRRRHRAVRKMQEMRSARTE